MTGVMNCVDMESEQDHINSMEYWKAEAEIWKARYENIRVELDEFAVSSRELEHELETELDQYKQQNSRLKCEIQTLTEENRNLKENEQRISRRLTILEDQIKSHDQQKQSLLQYQRELEQKNDDMETAHRNLSASLADQAKRLEELTEAKALAENELENCRNQKEVEQRLRDELKDVQDELAVRRKSEEARQAAAESQQQQLEQHRKRSIEASGLNADNEISRLQNLAGGCFERNQQNKLIKNFEAAYVRDNAVCRVNPADRQNSIIHSLVKKISTLETRLVTVHSHPVNGANRPIPRSNHLR